MASPQTKHGFTRIANEILQAVASCDLSGFEVRFIVWLLRLTYGYNRKEVRVNIETFARTINMTVGMVNSIIIELELRQIISSKERREETIILSFNKNHEIWQNNRLFTSL